MILIISAPEDAHADAVERLLERQGVAFRRFDPGAFPASAHIALRCGAGRPHSVLRYRGEELNLDEVGVVWFRRPSAPAAHPAVTDDFMRGYVAMESQLFLEDTFTSLGCPFVPALPAGLRRADLKMTQLRAAESVGFALPSTLITNDPEAFLAFRHAHGANLISKLPGPALFRQPVHLANRYTQRVSRADLGYLDALSHAPVVFQPYVDKALEVRATVVGGRVFAAEIHSQSSAHTATDWRRYDLACTPHRVHTLPPEIERRCLALTDALGLVYGAIDLILTPEGRYIFLEINPNGQYLWIEDMTGLPISAAIAELLIGYDAALAVNEVLR